MKRKRKRFEKESAALFILHFEVRCLAFDVGCSKRFLIWKRNK
jgi:hypothetical protein